jgi:hypothetical protein
MKLITLLILQICFFARLFSSAPQSHKYPDIFYKNPSIQKGVDVFQVLPNPGNGIYSVVFKSEVRGQLMLAVSDATGKYVYLKTIRDFNGELKEMVDIASNPKGIYIFEIESDNGRESKKVIYQ